MARRLTTLATYHALLYRTMCVWFATSFVSAPVDAVTTIGIEGWRQLDLSGDEPQARIGDDPVLGRMVCPPVSRVHLSAAKTDPLLVRDVVETSRPGKGPIWKYEVRSGLYWWSGDSVTGADFAAFLSDRLQGIIATLPVSPDNIPPFAISTEGYQVSVQWQKKPAFGPYVLNGKPLWRPVTTNADSAIRYECVGLYYPKKREHGYELLPTKGYGGTRPTLYLGGLADQGKRTIRFRSAGAFASNPWTRLSDVTIACTETLEQPLFSAIVWNLQADPTNDAEFRKILTNLTPRGALVRSASGYLGTLVSAPIPRSHPGYNRDMPVREFDLAKAAEALTKMGFKREKPNTPRLTPKGEPLILRLQTESETDGLLEKVLADSFASVGIGVEYVRDKPGYPHVHGVLTGMWVDWPQVDFLPYLTAATPATYPLFPIADERLEKAMAEYSRSLSQARPDFDLLKQVHKRLYDLEPFTVLMQHKTCLDVKNGLNAKAKQIDILDPDWFRSLVR